MTDNEREQVLKMIADGKISPEEGLKLMQVLDADTPEDAVPPTTKRTTSAEDEPHQEASGMDYDPRIVQIKSMARRLWQVPLWIGLGILLLSALGMYALVAAGNMNFWFFCLIAPLLLGVLMIALGSGSRQARWLFVDVNQKPGDRPKHIFLGFPLPLKLTAWFLRTFGSKIEDLKKTNVDEIIQVLETGFTGDEPLIVNVDEGDDGDRVKVYIG